MTAERSRLQALALAVVACVVVPFVVTGLFRLGLPGPAPFVVVLVVAVVCWLRGHRPIAVGLAAGDVAWALALVSILEGMA